MAKKKPFQMEFYGDDALLRMLDEMEHRLPQIIAQGMKESLKPVEKDLHQFTGVEHRQTLATEKSFEEKGFKTRANAKTINAWVGYNVKEGGEAAIFLQVGTPKMAPHRFITHIYHDHKLEMIAAQENYIKDYVERELKKNPPKVTKV